MTTNTLKLVVVGHVDDGKSTLIGRLLYETDSLPDGKLAELKAVSLKRNMPLEWSFVLDAFQAERDQAITIDTSQIMINRPGRQVTIIDAPGHIEFLKNMVSGAASADAAFLLVDASEGVRQQTRRHAYFLNFLGIQQVVVIVNKMDLVQYCEEKFNQVKANIIAHLQEVGITPQAIIPVSAREGDMLSARSTHMQWYQGVTVLDAMDNLVATDRIDSGFLRFPVQDVYKFDERRIIAGRVESGVLRVGDDILISPSNQMAKVNSIETWHAEKQVEARAGESIGITLDKQLFVERGDVVSHLENPPMLTTVFRATLFWLGHDSIVLNKTYKMKLLTREVNVIVQSIEYEIDTESLQKNKVEQLRKNQCGEVILRVQELLPVDEYHSLKHTGRFVLVDAYEIVAGGMISMKGFPNQRTLLEKRPSNLTQVKHYVTYDMRQQRSGHRGGVLWFTGLSGAGKSTLAMALEQMLFLKGYQVYTLDGDNIRSGLNSNLGFTPEDRAENIRRIGEVSALFADAGFVCVTAFISPYQADRNKVRRMLAQGMFHEIYIKADLEHCEERDPKGLYKKARKGEIAEFTGISAPYEAPLNPELIIDTVQLTVEQSVNRILEYVKETFAYSSTAEVVV
ncbi:NodQ bifunctional enzyme [Gammaproteobacteria bacterium SCGC AG-212-F23]|nr:NodQ bifunctional enzyme [Gammaproteobacteria bacterium SCGC AG-212-F23]